MREQRIEAAGANGGVPGRLYRPDGAEGRGLLLLGHGGGGSKDAPRFVSLAQRYAQGTGLNVLAIDGPVHGERAPRTGDREADFRTVRRVVVSREAVEQMAADWPAAASHADAVAGTGPAVAYVGFSMGTLFGVPTVAAMPSIKAAVFALGGVPRPGGLGELVASVASPRAAQVTAEEAEKDVRGETLIEAAAKIDTCSVLLLNMTRDEVFPPEGALRFFEALATPSKRLCFWEGGHLGLPPEAIDQSLEFVRPPHGARA